ncbi:TPR-like protein [Zopfia rhizophila CBS 207.26]|uniref:TPR-like protein n=1 Tax=Zopfia rhizophila CBS 207.26 TaxID=1314779 RepID=A0A6A6E1U2_9PEZI|nr:TPR-like protein [Zopfia rhizophila CBS 207.26]
MHYAVLKIKLFQRWGRIEDLEEAIEKGKHAMAETREEHKAYTERLNNLGIMLESRYMRTGNMEDLEEAIRVARQTVDVTPKDHPDLAAWLNNLGSKLVRRYERTGKMGDLEEAIRVARQAVDVTPEGYPHLAGFLNNLGIKLRSRYERMGKMEDLEEAIRVVRQAVDATPEDHPDLAALLNTLGNILGSRYERTEKIEDLEEAIRVARRAIGRLNNLGNKLDLEEAIRVARRAIGVTPEDHPDLAGRLNNLGIQLESRYEHTEKMEDLEEAIRVARQAVDVTPEDHLDLAGFLNNLGIKLGSRYERMGNMEDLEEAIRVTHYAWKCENATPFIRIRASTQAIRLLQMKAISMLPYYVVSHFSGLATTACSLALQTGKGPEAALEVLEQGRGVILSILMDDRSDTSELKAAYPLLCAQYESLCLEVNKSTKDIMDDRIRRSASASRREAIAKLEQCFHKGLTAKQMQSCSAEGSVIVVNVTDLRSDAIIVTADASSKAQDWVNQDLTAPLKNGNNKAYCQFLLWLWHGCVRPVLDELQLYAQPSADNLPRVWWIGTGIASSFPFHSAGDISNRPKESTCYRIISSYTPTFKALRYAQDRARTTTLSRRDSWKPVVVTMPKTPSAGDLPGTTAESSEVIAAMGLSLSKGLPMEHPNVASTLVQLQKCNIAHFACHGVSDPDDPSRSGLILQTVGTDTEEPRQDILSAEIAYLSACSTAQNRVVRLSDEVLHVVSGFQIAGFRHVVGCLWPSDDSVCIDVAKLFYSELFRNGTARYNDRAVALALHKAVVKVRESDNYCKRPLRWAQYVHFGA